MDILISESCHRVRYQTTPYRLTRLWTTPALLKAPAKWTDLNDPSYTNGHQVLPAYE